MKGAPLSLLYPFFSLFIFLYFCPDLARTQGLAPSILWQKSLGGSGDDQANSIVRTSDGGFIIAGASKSNDGDVSGHHGSIDSTDAWVVKLSATGAIQWQRSIGGSGMDELDEIINTPDGGFVGIGYTSSNDGDVSGNHGDWDVWVVKLDRNGNIKWQKCLGGSLRDYAKSIRVTNDNGLILLGNTDSNDGDVSGNPPGTFPVYAIWVAKLDSAGDLAWQNCYGAAAGAKGYDILPLADGTYVMGLSAQGGDGVPSDGIFYGGGNSPIGWMAKIGPTGQLLETQDVQPRASITGFKRINDLQFYVLQGLNYCYPQNPNNAISLSPFDTTINASNFAISTDLFGVCQYPGPSQSGYTANGPGSMVVTSSSGGVIAAATSDTATLLSPSLTHLHLFNHGGYRDALLMTFAPVSWGKCYGGSGDDVFQGLTALNDYTYIAAGYSNSNDGDVTGNHGGYDVWVVELGKTNIIKGSVYLDYNANGVRDSGEPLVNNVLVQSTKGTTTTANPTFNGIFANQVDTGAYSTAVVGTALPYYTASPSSHASNFTSYNNTDSFSFALQPIPGKRDYQISMNYFLPARPGFNTTYQIEYANLGTDTLLNRTVQLIKDHRLIYLSASPAATSVTADTIRWVIPTLSPRDTGMINVQWQVPAPPTVNQGDSLLSIATIDSTGDLDLSDNRSVVTQRVTGSFDPNEKEESYGGNMPSADISAGKYLNYSIRFQNTGTDTAFTVVLKDTLSSKLDLNSIQMTGASAPYQLTVSNGNVLTWSLSNIRLPDSAQNAAGSQGWVSYRVRPLSSLVPGDRVNNSASVYFDFNPPVATAAQITLVTLSSTTTPLPIPPAPQISGLLTDYCANLGAQQIKITNIPPPSDSATVAVQVNGVSAAVGPDSNFSIQPGTYSPGLNSIRIIFSNSAGSDTAVWNFRIVPASMPVVGISSSSFQVTSGSAPVIITAANSSGGGSDPLYTFARDRGFDSVLQAESVLYMLTLSPSSLSTGVNTIYVRMKTSDTCYTMPYGMDSIRITLAAGSGGGSGGGSPVAGSGLTDPDYPNQLIQVDPNPFFDKLYITGLHTVKAYTVSLLSCTGQEMVSLRIEGQQAYEFNIPGLSKGMYLLRCYDESKGKLIGYLKLVSLGK